MTSLSRYYRRRNAKIRQYLKVWLVMAMLWTLANLVVIAVNAII